MHKILGQLFLLMLSSWYGPWHHGRQTASGELFDMQALTAAHKTLPFGTRLRLTNPRNKRTVVVRVNDRGPYVEGRDLDVSQEAARQLDFESRGLERLEVEVVQ